MAHSLRRKYAHVVRRKCRIHRQQPTNILLRIIRQKLQEFARSSVAGLHPWACIPPKALLEEDVFFHQWQLWLTFAHQQLQRFRSHHSRLQLGHVKRLSPSISLSPLQRLSHLCPCSTTTGLGQGNSGLRSCCAMLANRSMGRMARFSWFSNLSSGTRPCGHSKCYLQKCAFLHGILPNEVNLSLVTPVFKKGDRCEPPKYRSITVGELLCRSYTAILNRLIVSWAEEAGLQAPCQAGFWPRMST